MAHGVEPIGLSLLALCSFKCLLNKLSEACFLVFWWKKRGIAYGWLICW